MANEFDVKLHIKSNLIRDEESLFKELEYIFSSQLVFCKGDVEVLECIQTRDTD
jgi:hypothetical protein